MRALFLVRRCLFRPLLAGLLVGCVAEDSASPARSGVAAAKSVDTAGDTASDTASPVPAGCVAATDGDHSFLFCAPRLPWAEAQAACSGWGYHLADADNAAENAWIWAVAEPLEPAYPWWLGFNDRATEAGYAWDGGASAPYRAWRAGEPNDYAANEDCAAFADDGGAAWNDKDCAQAYPFVCEAGCLWSDWYADVDADGYGDAAAGSRACAAPPGTVADATDCEDAAPGLGTTDWHADADGDGFGDAATAVVACDAPADTVADATDCDDADATIFPGTEEIAHDGIDQDCDGADRCTWNIDADGDGYGDPGASLEDCGSPAGYVLDATDCDDADPAVHPTAAESLYDGADSDCDGGSDFDADGDGFESDLYGGSDCVDTDPAVFPSAAEACNAADDDCDAAIDEGGCSVSNATFDGHTYLFFPDEVTWAEAQATCTGFGYHLVDVRESSENVWIWSMAEATDATTGWWLGLSDTALEGRFAWEGGSPSTYTDWRPGEPNDYAGAEDCGAWADDGAGAWNDTRCAGTLPFICEAGCEPTLRYADGDGDGFGDAATATESCDVLPGVLDGTDCDDSDPGVSPAAAEVCDPAGVDEDCDGLADDGDPDVDPATRPIWYADADGDGFGDPSRGLAACNAVFNDVADATDCDDAAPDTYPGALETVDGLDTDCDGFAERYDSDGDGLSDDDEAVIGSDADDPDTDADGVYDGVEVVDLWAVDTDGDGHPDFDDADDDGDRLTTRAEIGAYDASDPLAILEDVDGDGAPDHHDLDTDADGVPDGDDSLADTDGDGLANVADPDDDGDGLPTADEIAVDSDGDGAPDADVDADGVRNELDRDTDGDGCPDGAAGGPDTLEDADGDGLADFADSDSCSEPAPDTDSGPDPDTAMETGGRDSGGDDPDGCTGCNTGNGAVPGFALAVVALLGRRRRGAPSRP